MRQGIFSERHLKVVNDVYGCCKQNDFEEYVKSCIYSPTVDLVAQVSKMQSSLIGQSHGRHTNPVQCASMKIQGWVMLQRKVIVKINATPKMCAIAMRIFDNNAWYLALDRHTRRRNKNAIEDLVSQSVAT